MYYICSVKYGCVFQKLAMHACKELTVVVACVSLKTCVPAASSWSHDSLS